MIRVLREYFEAFIGLLFPKLCVACLINPIAKGHIFCVDCLFYIPESDSISSRDNRVFRKFSGRFRVEDMCSLYLFEPAGRVKRIIHLIKYEGRRDIAQIIGKYMGEKLLEEVRYQSIDEIIPVPLHSKKRAQRGYNQSEEFARGLADGMNIPINTAILTRIRYTATQTKKTRLERLENVLGAFELEINSDLTGKHVLLVDDVITTGATLEGCMHVLQNIPDIKVSIASMALASD